MDALLTIATRHQSHFERLKTHEAKKFDEFLRVMETDIKDVLSKRAIPEFKLTQKQLNRQLDLINAALTGTYKEYHKVWVDSTRKVGISEGLFEKDALESIVDGINFQLPSDAQLMAAVNAAPIAATGGKVMKEVWKDFTAANTKRLGNLIRLGYAEGKTTTQVISEVSKTGIPIVKRAQVALVRTTLQHASNQARMEVLKENRGVVRGVRWTATLDRRTAIPDAALDGRVFPLDKGPRPPLHINCRCTIVAELKKKYEHFSRGRTRSERDPITGAVTTGQHQSYYGWLKGQPADVQNSIIGPSRGKLLRNGGLTSKRFAALQIDKNFAPLTLDEMKKLNPVAFTKAGL